MGKQHFKEGLLSLNGVRNKIAVLRKPRDADMPGETADLVTDLPAKAGQYGDGDEHDRKAQRNGCNGNEYNRAGITAPAAFDHPAG